MSFIVVRVALAMTVNDELRTAPGRHQHVKWPWTAYHNQQVAAHLAAACGSDLQGMCGQRDLYEFGVLSGRSVHGLCLDLNASHVPFRQFWGFDSFVGLPPEAGRGRSSVSERSWQPGSWSAAEILHQSSYKALQAQLLGFINDSRVSLIRGFFNDSLTVELAKSMRPALYVMVDSDLYTSAVQALSWLCDNELLVKGSLIVYNDWDAGGSSGGEQMAHREIVARYQMRTTDLGRSTTGRLFRVDHAPRALPADISPTSARTISHRVCLAPVLTS